MITLFLSDGALRALSRPATEISESNTCRAWGKSNCGQHRCRWRLKTGRTPSHVARRSASASDVSASTANRASEKPMELEAAHAEPFAEGRSCPHPFRPSRRLPRISAQEPTGRSCRVKSLFVAPPSRIACATCTAFSLGGPACADRVRCRRRAKPSNGVGGDFVQPRLGPVLQSAHAFCMSPKGSVDITFADATSRGGHVVAAPGNFSNANVGR